MNSVTLDTTEVDAATSLNGGVNCPTCGSSDIRPSEVHTAFWHKDRLVVVEDIPALVCNSCKEQFYDDSTVTLLDMMRGDGFPEFEARREVIVPVFSFSDRVKHVRTQRAAKSAAS